MYGSDGDEVARLDEKEGTFMTEGSFWKLKGKS